MLRRALLKKEVPTVQPEARTFQVDTNGKPTAEIHWVQAIYKCTDVDVHGEEGWRFVSGQEEIRTFDKALDASSYARQNLLPTAQKIHLSLGCHEPICLCELKIDGIRQSIRS